MAWTSHSYVWASSGPVTARQGPREQTRGIVILRERIAKRVPGEGSSRSDQEHSGCLPLGRNRRRAPNPTRHTIIHAHPQAQTRSRTPARALALPASKGRGRMVTADRAGPTTQGTKASRDAGLLRDPDKQRPPREAASQRRSERGHTLHTRRAARLPCPGSKGQKATAALAP